MIGARFSKSLRKLCISMLCSNCWVVKHTALFFIKHSGIFKFTNAGQTNKYTFIFRSYRFQYVWTYYIQLHMHLCWHQVCILHTFPPSCIRHSPPVRLFLLRFLSFSSFPLSVFSFAFSLPHLHSSEIPLPLLLSTSHTLLWHQTHNRDRESDIGGEFQCLNSWLMFALLWADLLPSELGVLLPETCECLHFFLLKQLKPHNKRDLPHSPHVPWCHQIKSNSSECWHVGLIKFKSKESVLECLINMNVWRRHMWVAFLQS